MGALELIALVIYTGCLLGVIDALFGESPFSERKIEELEYRRITSKDRDENWLDKL